MGAPAADESATRVSPPGAPPTSSSTVTIHTTVTRVAREWREPEGENISHAVAGKARKKN